MRVTTSTLFMNARSQIARGQSRTDELRTQMGTGKKVHTFGDDPVAAHRIAQQHTTLANIDDNKTSIRNLERTWGLTEQALTTVGDAVIRLREISTQFANDTYNGTDRANAARELGLIRDQLVELANTQVDGRYVFGGIGSGAPPFDAAGAFTGDTGRLEVQITSRTRLPGTLAGGEPFVDPAGGPSLFDTITTLEAALNADDATAIGNHLTEIEGHETRLLTSRQAVGHYLQRTDFLMRSIERVELEASATLSAAEDTDFVDAMVQYRQNEQALQAAMMLTSRLEQLSLVNFI